MQEDQDRGPSQWSDLRRQFDIDLAAIEKQQTTPISRAQSVIPLVIRVLQDLDTSIKDLPLPKHEEILFYKQVRPFYLARLYYHSQVYEFEVLRPLGSPSDQAAYIQRHLQTAHEYFDRHHFLFAYLRTGRTHMDESLFYRPHENSLQALYGIIAAPPELLFPVTYDHIVGKITALESFQQYLLAALEKLESADPIPLSDTPLMVWTESKTGLIELMYALHASKVFNHGKTDLKAIVDYLQKVFHINVGNHSRTFQEILARKKGYTTMLRKLEDALLLRIDAIEDQH
jgi:hypothetical protein